MLSPLAVVCVDAAIRHEQIAPAVEGQSNWRIQTGGKLGSYPGRSKFIDRSYVIEKVSEVEIPHKQIAPAVEGQSQWLQTGGKGGLYPGRSEFIDGAARIICHKQVARGVKKGPLIELGKR